MRWQQVLDLIGIADPTGVTDLANALIYLLRGNGTDAAISLVAMVPYFGDAAKLGKLGKLEAKAAKGAAESAVAALAAAAGRMTSDQRALKELVDEVTRGGRKALSKADAETVLDWAGEVSYPGVRAGPGDLASPSNWTATGQPHIHLPGAGRGGHVPVQPGVLPRAQ